MFSVVVQHFEALQVSKGTNGCEEGDNVRPHTHTHTAESRDTFNMITMQLSSRTVTAVVTGNGLKTCRRQDKEPQNGLISSHRVMCSDETTS